MYHTPVLKEEVLALLDPRPEGIYLDCTLGGGGHAEAILERTQGKCELIGIDADAEAVAAAKEKLKRFKNVTFCQENFSNLTRILTRKVDGILFDLGVSSHQLDDPSRGFSLQKDGPLDMRMSDKIKTNAEKIVNQASVSQLTDLIKTYGEEWYGYRIAKAIVFNREKKRISTTTQLADIIKKAVPLSNPKAKLNCVTRTFQSLRILVNDELNNLEKALKTAINLLNPAGLPRRAGRIVVISYHSLEDRIVKHTFKKCAELKILTKKPVTAAENELKCNPRSRSAKLRAAEKIICLKNP